MYSINQPALTSVFDSAYRFASKNVFFQNFTEQSNAGNEYRIIEMIQGIPELENLTISKSYVGKNDEEAKKFLKEAEQTDRNNIKLSRLTRALFAAKIESDDKKIFFDILICVIRRSFASECFKKCLKDCQYMISLLNEKVCPNLNEKNNHIYKIECLSYETRCLKILGQTEKAKILARNGMREAKNFFQRMEETGEAITDEKKLEKLRPFLEVLNQTQNVGKLLDTKSGMTNTREIITPKVLGKQNNRLQSCSDFVALKYDNAKGRHLVATKNIKTGSVLIVDKPFSWSTDKDMLDNNCLHCHESLESNEAVQIPCHNCQTVKFCSEECRVESWKKYHSWECLIFDYFYRMQKNQSSRLLLAYRTTVLLATRNVGTDDDQLSSELMKYYAKDINDPEKLEIGLNDVYDPLDYRTVYSLRTNGKYIDPKVNLMHAIHSVILAKCFRFVAKTSKSRMNVGNEEEKILATATLRHLQAINSNAYEIVENVLNVETKIWEPRTVGGAVYPTVSLTNHSCFPNVIRHTYPKGKVAVRAIRFIRKGTEILDCYGPHFLRDVKQKRREYLLRKYNFHCVCEACENDLGPPLPSALYKCKNCAVLSEKWNNRCSKCGSKIDRMKIGKDLEESIQQRFVAIQKMLDGDYAAALPILLRHAELIDKIFADSSMESIKTQQALIQCLNSMGCISK